MKKIRIIARLDVKGSNVIKGVNLECLRVVGKPEELSEKYYNDGIDELIYIDSVASLYRRNNLLEIVNRTSEKIFIPFTVGGGIRTIEDIKLFLQAGADKVAINTAITENPDLIDKSSKTFGSQCIVASIQAKKIGDNKWEAYTNNGREKTGLDVIEWAKEVEKRGAGEILLTSVDNEGTKKGFDTSLIRQVSSAVSIPVIASGGAGSINHIRQCFEEACTDSIAIASLLHYNILSVLDIKNELSKTLNNVRMR